MTIHNNPVIDNINFTITVEFNIDPVEPVVIMINGLLAVIEEDIEDITDNIITLVSSLDIDYINDSLTVIYTKI